MKHAKLFISDAIEFSIKFPFFVLSGIFFAAGIIGLFSNWALAFGSFAFAVVLFIGQITVNKSS